MDQQEETQVENGKTMTHFSDWEDAFRMYEGLIASRNEALQIKATFELGRLSKDAPEPVLMRTIPYLVEFLSHPSLCIQESSVYCISLFARRGDTICNAVGQSGAIPLLLRMFSRLEGRFQRLLVKCVRNIVDRSNCDRNVIVRNGGLEVILNSIALCGDETTRRYLLEILSALVTSKQAGLILGGLGGLPSLVESVRVGRMVSRARAAYAIGQLGSTRRGKRILIDLGVIPVLIELLQDGDMPAKLTAGNTLGIISSHVEYLRLVAQAGAIPLFVRLLEGPEPLGREIAEDVFCILAVVEENAVSIVEHLVNILRGTNDEAKAAAADVLWDLSSYQHLISVVRNSGAIPLLLELLQNGNVEVREKASGAIAQLSHNQGSRGALADAGAIPILIALLQEESDELKDNAGEALINFSEDPLLGDRMSGAFDIPAFHDIRGRLVRMRAYDESIQ